MKIPINSQKNNYFTSLSMETQMTRLSTNHKNNLNTYTNDK